MHQERKDTNSLLSEGPQAGGQEQFSKNQAPQVENDRCNKGPQAFQSQWNVRPKPRGGGWTNFIVFSILALFLGSLIGGGAGYF